MFLGKFKLAEYKPNTDANPVVRRRNKLAQKIDEQIKLASDETYQPTKLTWHKDENGREQRVSVPKRVKRWWVEQVDGTVLLTVRYGSRALELDKGKNAIQLSSKAEVEKTLRDLQLAVLSGELDALLEAQVNYGSKIGGKNL